MALTEKKKVDPALLVFRALLRGDSVMVDGYEVRIMEDDGGHRDLFFKGTRRRPGVEKEIVWLRYEMTVGGFIRTCEELSEDDLASISFRAALRSAAKPRENVGT